MPFAQSKFPVDRQIFITLFQYATHTQKSVKRAVRFLEKSVTTNHKINLKKSQECTSSVWSATSSCVKIASQTNVVIF